MKTTSAVWLLTWLATITLTMAALPVRFRRQAEGWSDPNHAFPESCWSGWTPCTNDCGGGYQARHNCSYDYPIPDAEPPSGLVMTDGCGVHTLPCGLSICNDGYDWQDFGDCDATCGSGLRVRNTGSGCLAENCNGQVLDESISCNTHSCTPPSECGKADLIFILDSSGSVGSLDWYRAKQFAIDVSKSLTIGQDASRIAAVTYSNEVALNFDLEAASTIAEVEALLWDIPWMAASTNTADGIRKAREVMSSQGRSDATHIMVVVTDGNSNILQETTVMQADLAKSEGSFIFAVGVSTNVNADELQGISSDPSNVFQVANFAGLASITQSVAETACDVEVCEAWSACPVTCGGVDTHRTRSCENGGNVWTQTEEATCGTGTCQQLPVVCGSWKVSGDCSETCGVGTQLYTRVCQEIYDGGDGQISTEEEYQACGSPPGDLVPSSECSVTCGSGMQAFTRTCNEGEPDETKMLGCEQDPCLECAMCDYGGSIGYLEHPSDCSKYYICVRHVLDYSQGTFLYTGPILKSCGAGTKWSQDVLTCDHDRDNECGAVSIIEAISDECLYTAVEGDDTKMQSTVDGTVQSCAPGTVFDLEECSCVHGYNPGPVCEDDLLLHYTFDEDFNSVTCNTAPAENYGPVTLEWDSKYGKSAYFNGQSRLVVHFMENYFAGNQVEKFSIALWFKWTGQTGGVLGLVNNGNCKGEPTFDIHVGSGQVVSGNMDTDTQQQTSVGDFWVGQWDWQHVVLVYDGSNLSIYLNCAFYTSKALQGPIQNNPDCPMTIGQLGKNADEGLFTGFIDDLRVYTKALTYNDVQGICGTEMPTLA